MLQTVERKFPALSHNNLDHGKGWVRNPKSRITSKLHCFLKKKKKNHTGNTAATVSAPANNVPYVTRLCSVAPIMTVKECAIFLLVILLYLLTSSCQYLKTDPNSPSENFPALPPSWLPSSLDSPQSPSLPLSLLPYPSLPVFLCSVSWKIGFKRPLLWTRASHTVGPVRFIFHTMEGKKKVLARERDKKNGEE